MLIRVSISSKFVHAQQFVHAQTCVYDQTCVHARTYAHVQTCLLFSLENRTVMVFIHFLLQTHIL